MMISLFDWSSTREMAASCRTHYTTTHTNTTQKSRLLACTRLACPKYTQYMGGHGGASWWRAM
jgi:hypothetical protein